jgi:hypothetical protein
MEAVMEEEGMVRHECGARKQLERLKRRDFIGLLGAVTVSTFSIKSFRNPC